MGISIATFSHVHILKTISSDKNILLTYRHQLLAYIPPHHIPTPPLFTQTNKPFLPMSYNPPSSSSTPGPGDVLYHFPSQMHNVFLRSHPQYPNNPQPPPKKAQQPPRSKASASTSSRRSNSSTSSRSSGSATSSRSSNPYR